MKFERERLNTYWNWPASSCQMPSALARAGFFYTGESDRVKCAFCRGVLKKWVPSDEPTSAHSSHFPRCPFVRGEDVENNPLEFPQYSAETPTNNPEDMTIENNRLKSFSAWPSGLEQTPDSLARAGFYHLGNAQKPDRVKCAYCRGRLFDWEAGDDPWMEHARNFPMCPYIKLCMSGLY